MIDDLPLARPVLGFAEVVLNVHDLPAMRDFYTRVLGFKLHSEECHETEAGHDPSGEPTICFLTVCSAETPLALDRHPPFLVLIDFRRHASAKSRGIEGAQPNVSTLNHLAFEISPESFEAEHARLAQLGLEPSATRFPALNARALFFQDPEGNTLELICRFVT